MEELSLWFSCVLCEKRATMLCDSDQAKLCWDCDEKVHSANFLVAKHSRVLLCGLCHAPTSWKAYGTKLTPTLSFCHRCVADRNARLEQLMVTIDESVNRHRHDHDHVTSDVYDEDHHDIYDDDDSVQDEDEKKENQVIPISSQLQDETACSSSQMLSSTLSNGDESTSISILKKHPVDKPN